MCLIKALETPGHIVSPEDKGRRSRKQVLGYCPIGRCQRLLHQRVLGDQVASVLFAQGVAHPLDLGDAETLRFDDDEAVALFEDVNVFGDQLFLTRP